MKNYGFGVGKKILLGLFLVSCLFFGGKEARANDLTKKLEQNPAE